jgi:hypothetical protein
MVDYAEAMVAVEAQRRTEVAGKIPRTSVKKTS